MGEQVREGAVGVAHRCHQEGHHSTGEDGENNDFYYGGDVNDHGGPPSALSPLMVEIVVFVYSMGSTWPLVFLVPVQSTKVKLSSGRIRKSCLQVILTLALRAPIYLGKPIFKNQDSNEHRPNSKLAPFTALKLALCTLF